MPKMLRGEKFLTPAEVGRVLGVTGWTVRQYIQAGRLPAVRTVTGRYLIREDDARSIDPRPYFPTTARQGCEQPRSPVGVLMPDAIP